MKELAKNWLDYAKRDLQAAQQLVSTADLAGLVAFHCQQCIEKSFKGLLEFYEQSIPRIHDLITLHQQVNKVENLNLDEETLRQVDDAYIDTRYPKSEMSASSQEPSLLKAQTFVKLAKEVYETATQRITPRSTEGQT